MTRQRWGTALLVLAGLVLGLLVALPGTQGVARASTELTRSVTAKRVFVDEDGTQTEVSSNRVTLKVSQTKDLRGRQEIGVSWTGAVPTRGVVADPHQPEAAEQEYPFVLLQCRGVDTTGKVPKGQVRLSPQTCWTQSTAERYFPNGASTPAWRFDAFAPAAERAATVGAPSELPAACGNAPASARWLPFRAASGTVYPGGPDPAEGCISQAPESSVGTNVGLPSNTTYGVTGANGSGRTDFSVWTKAENASLGCTATVRCALVAVPIVGLSCDAWGHKLPAGTQQTTNAGVPLTPSQLAGGDTSCRRTGKYEVGEGKSLTVTDAAVRGAFWWSASNWRNRITVPLEFAVSGEVCDVESAKKPLEIIGSVVANELAASWRPRFCTDKSLFTFTHIQQADSLARQAINTGELAAGFTTAPVGDSIERPVVQAPLTFGGFAIAFTVDGEDKERKEQLKLNARLVAKLLTESYPAVPLVRDNHSGLAGNPLNISLDPEFRALNPGLPESLTKPSAAMLQTLSTNADLVWALTSWLDADREARAFLDGTPDPWGMKVNPSYQEIELPVESWPLLDDFQAPDFFRETNACYNATPTPYLQLIANPLGSLKDILLNLQYGRSAVRTVCTYDGYDFTTLPFRTEGAQPVGVRFVIGLVTLSSAKRYNLRTAALQTTSSVPVGQRFSDAGGRTFVSGDDAGLKAAAPLMKEADGGRTWALDYAALNTAAGARAYPGAMPVYSTVPTSGLTDVQARDLADLICYSYAKGQSPGAANGRLPSGYLPLTASNGFGKFRDYQLVSAAAVRAQQGATPTVDSDAPSERTACPGRSSSTPKPTPTPTPEPPSDAPVTAPDPVLDVPAPATGEAPAVTDPLVTGPVALTAAQSSAFGAVGVPLLLGLALVSALTGAVLRWPAQIAAAGAAATRLADGLAARVLAGRGARRKP